MNPAMKNTLMGLLALAMVGVAGWLFFRSSKASEMPDTQETRTEWMCAQCQKMLHLTAKQVDDLRNSKDKVRRGAEFDPKHTVFWCDDCKTFTITRALHCNKHDEWYNPRPPSGEGHDCPKCEAEDKR